MPERPNLLVSLPRSPINNNCKAKHAGFTLAGLLVMLAIMVILWGYALPSWEKMNQREKELELIWRGQQFEKAIGRYYYKFGSYPPNMDILVEKKFLRKKYTDPFGPEGEWEILYQSISKREKDGSTASAYGPIIGVTSQSAAKAIIWYTGMHNHNLWRFVFYPQAAPPGQQQVPPGGQPPRQQSPRQQQPPKQQPPSDRPPD
ncbi:MAG: hypothetical protein A2Y62_01350 [Candidatus Fischerbacteria bacterium RBG_13_37_8]|uniref:Type II secretion system protein GspG C-terminal domain-containing protein n=1 Tax=Candidatus Fischerbacteria bacterium RBG_13_37_8 TaxID=1817863 RepID=A0A1F5VU62_9BACT|nr:MAG: hypothetical protein A2Y62_01350 [Candidatus Fischerbacteria bacterium RBG_13_37_8]